MTALTQTRARTNPLDWAALAAVGVALGFAFLTPPEVNQGNVARLFYLHVPSV